MRMKNWFALLAVAVLLAACASNMNSRSSASAKLTYPITKKVELVETLHGTPVPDPYRWLEDDNSVETKAWVEAQNKVTFTIEGAGKIIGVGNGDPNCHEPEQANQRSLFNGLAQVIVQSTMDAGEIKLTATADGLVPATAILNTQPGAPRPFVP